MRDTMHLSILEHGSYTLLLDAYYASEKPLPADYDALYRICRAMSSHERDAVKSVADRFFQLRDGCRHNPRADREIQVAQSTIEKQRKSGVESAAKRWGTDTVIDGSTHESAIQPPTTNHQPPSFNHQPEKRARSPKGSRLPSDWQPTEILKAWASKERPDLSLEATVSTFRDYWHALPGQKGCKLDWEATFRNWVRREKAGGSSKPADIDKLIRQLEEEERQRASV